MNPTPYQKRVEEEFDKKFTFLDGEETRLVGFYDGGEDHEDERMCFWQDYPIKSFFHSHHLQFLRDEIVRLEKEKQTFESPIDGKPIVEINDYNQALDSVISHYREMLTE